MKDGQQIRFTGEGDQEPDVEAGDVVIVLDDTDHEVFTRHGSDLSINMTIDLVDSLCGFQNVIETLDKRSLVVSSLPGKDYHVDVNYNKKVNNIVLLN